MLQNYNVILFKNNNQKQKKRKKNVFFETKKNKQKKTFFFFKTSFVFFIYITTKDTKKIRGQGQGQPFRGQTLSRPRTGMLEAKDQGHKRKCSPKKKKKKVFTKFFRRSPQKNVFQKIFQALHKILTIQKILLSSSRGQANFRGLEASRPRPRT